MTDRLDDAKRALDDVPAPDLWAEAQRRASVDTVVPLTAVAGRSSRSGRWLLAAAAAVAVMAVGAVALVADDESPVDTGPASPSTSALEDPATIYRAEGACQLGITGEPLPEPATVGPAETFVAGTVGTLVEGMFNDTQSYAVQVPGQVVTDLVGERVEDVQLQRGTGQLWFQADGAVQARWFTGSQDACESFTVTVGGGTEDGNRHAAVDLADRVLMPSELAGEASGDLGTRLERTPWVLDQISVDEEPMDGNGAAFAILDGEATWSDGCNTFSAPYTLPSSSQLVLGEVTSTELPCPTNPVTQAIATVMSTGTIELASGSGVDALFLTVGDTTLTLRPDERAAVTTTSTEGEAEAGVDEGA